MNHLFHKYYQAFSSWFYYYYSDIKLKFLQHFPDMKILLLESVEPKGIQFDVIFHQTKQDEKTSDIVGSIFANIANPVPKSKFMFCVFLYI